MGSAMQFQIPAQALAQQDGSLPARLGCARPSGYLRFTQGSAIQGVSQDALQRTDMGIDSRMVASSRARPGCAWMNVVPSTVCGARHSGSDAPATLTTGIRVASAPILGSCAQHLDEKESQEASALHPRQWHGPRRRSGWALRLPGACTLPATHANGATPLLCKGAALMLCDTSQHPQCL